MDTSSKAWLPHQSQFGLVGQAEVCCGGPGVNLTPSESADPPSVDCPVTASSPVLCTCFYMSPAPVHVPAVSVTKTLLFFFFSTHTRPFAARFVPPFSSVASVSFYRHNEALTKLPQRIQGFYFIFLFLATQSRSGASLTF